jgi:hypothetical protein
MHELPPRMHTFRTLCCLVWAFQRSLCVSWQIWTMFLVALCMMARASCITTYCPTMDDTRLPPKSKWDADGLPQYIELGMRCARVCLNGGPSSPRALAAHTFATIVAFVSCSRVAETGSAARSRTGRSGTHSGCTGTTRTRASARSRGCSFTSRSSASHRARSSRRTRTSKSRRAARTTATGRRPASACRPTAGPR